MQSYEIRCQMMKLNNMITPSIQQLWDMISLRGYQLFKVVLCLLRITVYINIVENTIYIPSIEAFGFPQPAHHPCLSLILHRIPGDGLTGARLEDLNAVRLRYMLYRNQEPLLKGKIVDRLQLALGLCYSLIYSHSSRL